MINVRALNTYMKYDQFFTIRKETIAIYRLEALNTKKEIETDI
jgi:hypothetical protein